MAPRLNVLGIVVADMAASLTFYRRLGLEVPAESDTEVHAEATLPGGFKLAFDTPDVIRSFEPGWTPSSGGHAMALAFECDSPAEVDAVYDELVGAGHVGHLAPWDAFWGQRYATVLDPDGNSVDLYAVLDAPHG